MLSNTRNAFCLYIWFFVRADSVSHSSCRDPASASPALPPGVPGRPSVTLLRGMPADCAQRDVVPAQKV